MVLLTLALLFASHAFALLLSWTAVALVAAIAAASALYSMPPLHWKSQPVGGSLLHVLGGTIHCLLGYTTFEALDLRGVALGLFFGLVFAAGHLMHEVRDHEPDKLNGIRTNAVAFGTKRSFLVGVGLFTCAYALLVSLAATGDLPHSLVWVGALCPVHLAASLEALRAGLSSSAMRRLQLWYRFLFATIGIAMTAAVLLDLLRR